MPPKCAVTGAAPARVRRVGAVRWFASTLRVRRARSDARERDSALPRVFEHREPRALKQIERYRELVRNSRSRSMSESAKRDR
jgi:hypothetical protein